MIKMLAARPIDSRIDRKNTPKRGKPWKRKAAKLDFESLEQRNLFANTADFLGHFDDPSGVGGVLWNSNVDGVLFFQGIGNDLQSEGIELYRSDGTQGGTDLVKDIAPGNPGGMNPNDSVPEEITNINGVTFFSAMDASGDRELYRSNGFISTNTGNDDGTVLVKDINTSSSSNPRNITNVNGTIFFTAHDGTDIKLYRSDGTTSGTAEVTLPLTNTLRINDQFASLTNVNGNLYFMVEEDPTPGMDPPFGSDDRVYQLWRTDGDTSEKVSQKWEFTTTNDELLNPFELTNVNGLLLFGAYGTPIGTNTDPDALGLWKSDGTDDGTDWVLDGVTSPNEAPPSNLTNVNGSLFFVTQKGADGDELWISDGTKAGTEMVKNIDNGSGNSIDTNNAWLTNVNGTLFFVANDGTGSEVWRSDGTDINNGTRLVETGTDNTFNPEQLHNSNGMLFFAAEKTGATGSDIGVQHLWRTDGLETRLVHDTTEGVSSHRNIAELQNVNGHLFFTSLLVGAERSTSLWVQDRYQEPGVLIAGVDVPGVTRPNTEGPFVDPSKGVKILHDPDPDQIPELVEPEYVKSPLWVDKTHLELLEDLEPGETDSDPRDFTNVDGYVFFTAIDNGVRKLHRTNGEGDAPDTDLVRDGSGNTIDHPRYLTNMDGTLYFSRDGLKELWKVEGNDPEIVNNVEVYPTATNVAGNASDGLFRFMYLTNVEGSLFFSAKKTGIGDELYISHGTGATLVNDILPGSESSFPTELTNVDGTLYFSANDGQKGFELHKSDGLTTERVFDIYSGTGNSLPKSLTNVNGTLYFSAKASDTGRELWKHNDIETVNVIDIRPGQLPSNPQNLTNVQGILYFSAMDQPDQAANNHELWTTDGTNTYKYELRHPDSFGNLGANPRELTNVNGYLYFTAFTPQNGRELYWLDAGKEISDAIDINNNNIYDQDELNNVPDLIEIRPGGGSGGSSMVIEPTKHSWLTNVNGTLYFTAIENASIGYELYRIQPHGDFELVKDIRTTGVHSSPRYMTNANGHLFFGATDGITGREPYVLKDLPVAQSSQSVFPPANGPESNALTMSWLHGDTSDQPELRSSSPDNDSEAPVMPMNTPMVATDRVFETLNEPGDFMDTDGWFDMREFDTDSSIETVMTLTAGTLDHESPAVLQPITSGRRS